MSPIRGYTDRKRLPRIGKIHLGVKVPTADGKSERPAAVEWFEVHPDATTPQAAFDAFSEVYGEQPKELDIMFPADDELLFADANYKAYSQTHGLVCKGNGETADALWDSVGKGLRPPDAPAGTWATHDSQAWARTEIPCLAEECPMQVAKKCRAVMNLQFFLPEVKGFGIWQVDVGSWHSIVNIRAGIDLVKAATGGRIRGIPLRLRRISKEVSPPGVKKKTVYVLDLYSPLSLNEVLVQARQLGAGGMLLLPAPDEQPPDDIEDAGEAPEDVSTHMSNCASLEGGECDCDTSDIPEPANKAPVEPDDIPFETAEDYAPNPPMITEAQKDYLIGGGTIPREQSLCRKWVEKRGGMKPIMEDFGSLDPAIAYGVILDEKAEMLKWRIAILTETQAEAMIAALKKELGIKDRKKKEPA